MKRAAVITAFFLACSTMGGCIVPAPGPVYVEPSYPSPGPGYVWDRHPQNGWGWRHPEKGWHQGWR